ncbi:MAG TPA: metallophosphoesterase [Piscinibacter sp.]|uniref:metallophosphoesterase n=1 Tax=Piscinibacter sp. TaxID=1903157 RepID=UPI002C0E47BC|nr:metallophosphoesterase [Piscinibacter sp.]
MRIQLLSDLHLETEAFEPEPNPAAELLVLGGDIDSRWDALARFAGWPVPVLMVAGNHEFDGRELGEAWPALRTRCESLGITLLERESLVLTDAAGARIRFVATVRWCDFDLFGDAGRATAMRAAAYYMRIMRSTRRGVAFDAEGVREEALACREWLAAELAQTGDWDRTVVLTHFAPSLRSADPRYGAQPGTASFCNADDALLPLASTWIHGHLHCRHDYLAEHAAGRTRVICHARGHARKGEAEGYDPLRLFEV